VPCNEHGPQGPRSTTTDLALQRDAKTGGLQGHSAERVEMIRRAVITPSGLRPDSSGCTGCALLQTKVEGLVKRGKGAAKQRDNNMSRQQRARQKEATLA